MRPPSRTERVSSRPGSSVPLDEATRSSSKPASPRQSGASSAGDSLPESTSPPLRPSQGEALPSPGSLAGWLCRLTCGPQPRPPYSGPSARSPARPACAYQARKHPQPPPPLGRREASGCRQRGRASERASSPPAGPPPSTAATSAARVLVAAARPAGTVPVAGSLLPLARHCGTASVLLLLPPPHPGRSLHAFSGESERGEPNLSPTPPPRNPPQEDPHGGNGRNSRPESSRQTNHHKNNPRQRNPASQPPGQASPPRGKDNSFPPTPRSPMTLEPQWSGGSPLCVPGHDNLQNKTKKIQERETGKWLLLLFSKKACWKTAQSSGGGGSSEPTISLSVSRSLALCALASERGERPRARGGGSVPQSGGKRPDRFVLPAVKPVLAGVALDHEAGYVVGQPTDAIDGHRRHVSSLQNNTGLPRQAS